MFALFFTASFIGMSKKGMTDRSSTSSAKTVAGDDASNVTAARMEAAILLKLGRFTSCTSFREIKVFVNLFQKVVGLERAKPFLALRRVRNLTLCASGAKHKKKRRSADRPAMFRRRHFACKMAV